MSCEMGQDKRTQKKEKGRRQRKLNRKAGGAGLEKDIISALFLRDSAAKK